VNAGIRSPREIPANGFLGEPLPRGLQFTLNRLRPLLELRAGIVGAVIFQGQGDISSALRLWQKIRDKPR